MNPETQAALQAVTKDNTKAEIVAAATAADIDASGTKDEILARIADELALASEIADEEAAAVEAAAAEAAAVEAAAVEAAAVEAAAAEAAAVEAAAAEAAAELCECGERTLEECQRACVNEAAAKAEAKETLAELGRAIEESRTTVRPYQRTGAEVSGFGRVVRR